MPSSLDGLSKYPRVAFGAVLLEEGEPLPHVPGPCGEAGVATSVRNVSAMGPTSSTRSHL